MNEIKKGFDQGVFAARQFGAEYVANPGSSKMEHLNDAAWYFGEGKTYATLTAEERDALNKAFNEGMKAEKEARKVIGNG
jgi:hypothetical protein